MFIFISLVDYSVLQYYWKFLLGVITAVLVITYLLGDVRFGAVRWVSFGTFSAQPSEFAKIILVIALSYTLSYKEKYLSHSLGLFKLGIMVIPLMILVLIQPDLGTFIILSNVFIFVLFSAGLDIKYLFLGFIGLGFLSAPIWNLLHAYQQKRILVFLNPGLDTQGFGYNVFQSVIAIGSGGLTGKGFLRGTQSHLGFLPAFWTDFIFASFAEEWGFLGVIVLLIMFILLLICIVKIYTKARDSFGRLLCAGVFIIFFTQFFINVGMNLGIMPVTGIPLPFVSYGGSSIISLFISLGIVHSVWVWRKV